jgi:hypothetical protein
MPSPDREKRLRSSKDYYHRNKVRVWERDVLQKLYGLSLEDYEEMLDQQDGKCAICGSTPDLRRLCVDHDHATGQVRGLLCRSCNLALGSMQDNIELLENAIAYLVKFN